MSNKEDETGTQWHSRGRAEQGPRMLPNLGAVAEGAELLKEDVQGVAGNGGA